MATMASKTKRKLSDRTENDEVNLQVMKDDLVLKSSSDEEEDSSESEESVYSGLEEEDVDEDDSSIENISVLSFEEDNSTSGEDEEESNEEEEEDEDSGDESEGAAADSEESMSVDSDEDDKKLSKKSAKLLKHHKRKSKDVLDNRRQSKTNLQKHQSDGDEISQKESGKLLKDKSGTRKSKKTSSSARSDNAEGQGEVKVNAPDEYQYDSSDEEDIRNTVGNIPMEWYKEYDHIGYSLMGAKILKPKTGDELDEFLNKMDNPDYWRTVKDKSTGQNVVLSQKDVEFIQRMRKGKYTDPNFQEFEPWIEFFTSEKMIHPVTNRPEHKRSFIPSRWERIKVGQYVHAIKMGWMKPSWEKEKKKEDDSPNFYELWEKNDQSDLSKRYQHHIPAPKPALPGHAESYNPPPEYLFTEEEEATWREKEPEERRIQFIPQSYSCLRHVPAYSKFINERFERCLDLYLCPRQRKMRMNVDPEDLIPKLPKPKDLQPFPTTQAIVYKGHENLVRCISVEPTGQWLVSGSDDQTIKFWEVSTGRCMKTLKVKGVVKSLAWNPNTSLCLLAAAIGEEVLIINPQLGDKLVISNTDNMLASYEHKEEEDSSSAKKLPVTWSECKGKEHEVGLRVRVTHPKELSQVTWHGRGDYLAVVMPKGDSMSVLIHQLSKRRSQNPFTKSKGLVQCVLFHPTRPFLFMATQRHVRVYNLLKQELSKKLMTNVKWVSSMAVHPGGDNLIIGSYDCRLGWFDLDLSTKPYKMLRHHKKAIRQVCYHKRYPLFASASDDGTIIVCHGMVYNDLLQNPLIVPVKVLRGHQASKSLGVLDCEFHPTQPWIFSSASDNTIRLFT